MKKLGKLNLKSEKMLTHEELVSFRGGSGSDPSGCPEGKHKYCCKTKWTGYEDYDWTCIADSDVTCAAENPISQSATTTCNQLADCSDTCTTYGS